MSYANGNDLLARYDSRLVGDICDDTGSRNQSPATDANVLTALEDGASMINAACQIGERYTQAQLAALTGTDAAMLKRLNCDIAFTYLCQRRGIKPVQYEEAYKRSEELLTKLKEGSLIFNVAANVAAGIPADEFPFYSTYATINLLRDATWNQFFPVRRRQSPGSGGYDGSY